MNRVSCQNQGMQRCRTNNTAYENNSANMSGMMPRQMRNRNMSQSCSRSPQQNPGRVRDCGCIQEKKPEENMNCGCNPEMPLERNTNYGCNPKMSPERNSNNYTPNNRLSCENDWRQEVPTKNRGQLLTYINEVSFGAYEALLYLDTHPDCPDGLRYFRENNEKRQFALKEYTRLYGPLNLDRVQITCDTPSWEWVNQPWPWEGGAC